MKILIDLSVTISLVSIIILNKHNSELSLICILYWCNIVVYWIPEVGVNRSTILGDKRYDLGIVNDSRNPLYLNGFFRNNYKRTNQRFSLSGLKGIYYCQIHAIIQMLALSGYVILGICTDWKYCKFPGLFFIMWLCVGIYFLVIVTTYYRNILNKTLLRKSMNKKEWHPFAYKDYGAKFETVPRQYIYLYKEDLLVRVLQVSEGFDKIFSVKASVTDDSDVYIYGEESEENKCINIRMFLQIAQLFDVHLQTLNEIYQSMVEKYLLGTYKDYDWYLTFIIVVNYETKEFRDILRHSIFQQEGFYRLPVGISKEKEVIYVASQEDTFGIKEYKKLSRNIIKQLDLVAR